MRLDAQDMSGMPLLHRSCLSQPGRRAWAWVGHSHQEGTGLPGFSSLPYRCSRVLSWPQKPLVKRQPGPWV